jgi:hypothetical protein
MWLKEKGDILAEIGRLIDVQLDGNSENSFLYAQIAKNWGSVYILEEDEGRIPLLS